MASAGHEIKKALDGADIIYTVGPAYSTKPFAEACKPHLREGQIVIVCPSSCGGSIEFKNDAGLDLPDEDIVVAETSTLPYAVRLLEATYDNGFNTAPGFEGVKAQSSLDYRYFNEDVGYGLVFLRKLGEQIEVATPIISAVITIVSLLMNRDYLCEARRTMETLGLSNYTTVELEELLL